MKTKDEDRNDTLKFFIERLSELIEDKGINRHLLTKATGCDNHTVANWFDKRFFPRHDSLIALSNYFQCSIDFLLDLSDNEELKLSVHPSNFKDRFLTCRAKYKFTNYRIAKQCGIQQATISKWLLHDRMPETETLIKLSELFNCSIDFLLGRTDS